MKHLIILLFIISQGTYAQEIQVATALSSVSANITNPIGIQYNPISGKIQIKSDEKVLYDLQIKIPDTVINSITCKRYAIKNTPQDSVCQKSLFIGISDSQCIIENGVPHGTYQSDTIFITVHNY